MEKNEGIFLQNSYLSCMVRALYGAFRKIVLKNGQHALFSKTLHLFFLSFCCLYFFPIEQNYVWSCTGFLTILRLLKSIHLI